MEEKLVLDDGVILASIDEVVVSSERFPIVGTRALATCVGILLYSPKHKLAIAAHVSSDVAKVINRIVSYLGTSDLYKDGFKYALIPGYYYNHYHILEDLEELFKVMSPYLSPMEYEYQKDGELPAHEFAFDCRSGKFVHSIIFSNDKRTR